MYLHMHAYMYILYIEWPNNSVGLSVHTELNSCSM